MTAEPLAVREGDRLVVARAIALPATCMKCGAAATERRARPFYFAQAWTWVLLLLGPFGALAMLALTKSAALAVPLCAACDARWNAGSLARKITSGVAVASTLAAVMWPLVAPGAAGNASAIGVTLLGLAAIAVAYARTSSRMLRATSIDERRVALAGVHAAAIDAACARATPGEALSARATTRLAARLLAAHVLAYTLGLGWAVAAIPIAVRALPLDVDPGDVQRISALVLRQILWPFAGVWVFVHVASLPWAFTRTDARLRWTRLGFVASALLVFVSAVVVGGVEWWKLVRPS